MLGKLILVPTPIGNLDDITLRAIQVLRDAELILCEDTRHTMKLLSHLGIENKVTPFHQHNEHKVKDSLVSQLSAGGQFALVTDAGTPGISDPGFLIVRACVEAGVLVECLPGPTAIIPALAASGFPSDRFVFMGFPPHKKGRQSFWKSLQTEYRTMVIYESPHRIHKAIAEAIAIFGPERRACVVRELTKIHESFHRGTLMELQPLSEKGLFRGEIVMVIEGKNPNDVADE